MIVVAAKKPNEQPTDRSNLRSYGWAFAGVGAAGVAAGAVFGVLTIGRKRVVDEHCEARLCDDVGVDAARAGRTWSTASTVSFIAGGVLLAGGLALVIGSPDGPRTTITTTPNGAFIAWTNQF